MVYTEPHIKDFVKFSEKLFFKHKNKNTGLIYFVSFTIGQK